MNWKQKSESSSLNNIAGSSRMKIYTLLLLFFLSTLFACNTNSSKPDEVDTQKEYSFEELNTLLLKDSTNAFLLNQRAQKYLEQKKIKEAFLDANQAARLDTNNAAYYVTVADVLLSMNRALNAKYALEKAVVKDPENEEAKLKLAEIYYIIRQYDKAMKQVDDVMRANPGNAKAIFIKSMSFKELGDTLNAINGFEKLIETDENNYDAYMQLGVIYSNLKNPVAVDYFSNAIRIKPDSEEAWYGKAYYFQLDGQLDRAIQEFTEMLTVKPCNIRAHFNLGYIHLVELNVFQQAIKHFDDAIACDPEFTKAIYNKGVAYESLGDIGNAKKFFSEALQINPDYQLAKDGLKRLQ